MADVQSTGVGGSAPPSASQAALAALQAALQQAMANYGSNTMSGNVPAGASPLVQMQTAPAPVSPLQQAIAAGGSMAGNVGAGATPYAAAGTAPSAPPAADTAPRGNTATGPGFTWGGMHWGPNDFVAFANWLHSRGANISTWAHAHPGAFALFNLDPNIKNFILTGQAGAAAGGMPHA